MLSLGQVRRNNTPPPPREQTSTIYHELQVLVLSKLQTQGHTQVCPLLPSSIINPPPPRGYTGIFPNDLLSFNSADMFVFSFLQPN